MVLSGRPTVESPFLFTECTSRMNIYTPSLVDNAYNVTFFPKKSNQTAPYQQKKKKRKGKKQTKGIKYWGNNRNIPHFRNLYI